MHKRLYPVLINVKLVSSIYLLICVINLKSEILNSYTSYVLVLLGSHLTNTIYKFYSTSFYVFNFIMSLCGHFVYRFQFYANSCTHFLVLT